MLTIWCVTVVTVHYQISPLGNIKSEIPLYLNYNQVCGVQSTLIDVANQVCIWHAAWREQSTAGAVYGLYCVEMPLYLLAICLQL
jgi:hypothetical protein